MPRVELNGLYKKMLQNLGHSTNHRQLELLDSLQPSMDRFTSSTPSLMSRAQNFFKSDHITKGAYIYGEVGSGKTMIMDLFHGYCPLDKSNKLRVHFNEFMLNIHSRAHQLRSRGMHGDWVVGSIIKEMSNQYRLICLDELQVVDIADAMILRSVLEFLFREDITLLVTSNRVPKDLYMNGIQRASFLPCISLIEEKMRVLCLDSGKDYRRDSIVGGRNSFYFSPLNEETNLKMGELFAALTNDAPFETRMITVMGRTLQFPKAVGDIVWLTYEELFTQPLSAADYLGICSEFKTIFVTGIPSFSDMNMRPEARRFVVFIDIVYDMRRRLVLTSNIPIDQLFRLKGRAPHNIGDLEMLDALDATGTSVFTGDEEVFAATRAISRLHQISSEAWWRTPDTPQKI